MSDTELKVEPLIQYLESSGYVPDIIDGRKRRIQAEERLGLVYVNVVKPGRSVAPDAESRRSAADQAAGLGIDPHDHAIGNRRHHSIHQVAATKSNLKHSIMRLKV